MTFTQAGKTQTFQNQRTKERENRERCSPSFEKISPFDGANHPKLLLSVLVFFLECSLFGFMAKNKRKKAILKLKKFEELRQELVLALVALIPASSTSPMQINFAYDNSGSCTSKSSHPNGRVGPNYEEFEDSEEEEDVFSSTLCKEDEANASKFIFSSMSDQFVEDCLVLHESHAQPIS